MKEYGLYQVTLSLPFRLNHVHCYLARKEDAWTIIDTGLHTEKTRSEWAEAFAAHHLNPEQQVEKIILTHYHPDHFGFSGALQEWTGAPVYMSEEGKRNSLSTWTEETFQRNRQFYESHGMPQDINSKLAENDRAFYSLVRPFPQSYRLLKEGQSIQIGELYYEIIHTPGHAEGHLCFYNKEEKIFIGGDQILRKITPNISYHGYGNPNPLNQYLGSLQQLQKLDIKLLLPGHGPIFSDVHERIAEIISHHEDRLHQLHGIIRGEMTAFEACQKLFERELSTHEIRFAIGETIAHLNYLVARGELKEEREPGGRIYYSK